jgi:mannan endo-1,4-beta-mannosidase
MTDKEINMKKRITSALLAFILAAVSVSSCGNGNSNESTTAAGTEAAQTEAGTETVAETAKPLSDPVAMTADGDVDMEVALRYETDFDALLSKLDAKTVSPDHPVSENTNPETLALYQYLKEIYGKKVLSAQQLSNKNDKESIAYYYYTDDLPAIKGFDFIFKTTPNGDGDDWTQMAIDWHTKSNGIVYFCWHWNVPCNIDDPDNTGEAFYTEGAGNPFTTFSLANATTPGTKEYEVAVHDIDLIAHELQRLESAGVPVLWRPLHEASGAWFWWGIADRKTAENQYYQKLWYMIYDRLENYHKLTNLIWVWNGQNKHAMVHENTYDISGIDVYPSAEDHSALASSYKKLMDITAEGKMLALSECGYIPDPDELAANIDTVKWLFYMPWNGDFIYKGSTVSGIPRINEEKMTVDLFRRAMTSDIVVTWSELPDFEGTTRELPERVQLSIPDMKIQREKDAAAG